MKLIILAAILWGSTLSAQYSNRSFSEKLSFTADRNDFYARKLFEISKLCQNKLNSSFKKLPSKAKTVHIQLEGQPPVHNTWRVIYFKRQELEQMNSYQILHRINKKLIQRVISSWSNEKTTSPPEWFTAALLHDIQLGQENLLTQEKYPITRYAITNNSYPDVDSLIQGKAPSPENYWLYRMYCEQCAVLLRGIKRLKGGKDLIYQHLFKLESTSLTDLLCGISNDFISGPGRRQWYIKVCKTACFNIINPYPPELIEKQVNDMFSVTIARPGGKGTMRIPLEQLSSKEDEVLDNFYIGFLETDFFEIYMTSSVSIRPVLNQFIAALEELKAGDKDDFKDGVNKARVSFKRAVDYQKELNEFLNELEEKHNSSTSDYKLILKAQELAERRRKLIFPDWYSYMDELEKKLQEISLE